MEWPAIVELVDRCHYVRLCDGQTGRDCRPAIGGGHTFSTGGAYSLGGTIGQPDAGLLAGPGYRLSGGFWTGGPYRICLPVILRSY